MRKRLDADELRWRAESDARCLARAEEIKSDKDRHSIAKTTAQQMYAEQQKELQGLAKVSGKPVPKQTEPQPTKKSGSPYGVFSR